MQKNPKVAVIMVTFNRADVTCLALDALARTPQSTQFKLFIVDNNSKKEERFRIKECFDYLAQKALIDAELILSENNLGFAGGNNLALSAAFKDQSFTHICLLNNDTIVTPYWLDRLLAHDPKGLLGPVSNSVGNEQLAPVDYHGKSPDGYIRDKAWLFGQTWYEDHKGQSRSTEMLGFFCVLGSRDCFEKIGYLDSQFGAGTFEDDDFCERAKELGLPLEIARDVFIHHWGSATFSRMGNRKLAKLMKRNRNLFQKKHGVIWRSPVASLKFAYRAELENHYGRKDGDPKRRLENIKRYETVMEYQINWLFRPFDPLNPMRKLIAFQLALQFPALILKLVVRLFRIPAYITKYLNQASFKSHADAKFKDVFRGCKRVLLKNFGKINQTIAAGKKNLICLPICAYEGRRQRPQQLIEGLINSFDRCFWIEPQKVKFNGIFQNKTGIRQVYLKSKIQNFYIDQVPAGSNSEFDSSLLKKLVPYNGDLIVVVQSLYWRGHIDFLKKTAQRRKTKIKIVYDCMDLHTGFGSTLYHNEIHELNIIEASDILIASSDKIEEFLKGFNKPVYKIRNGCSIENFPLCENPPHSGKIGYFGAIAEWFDWDLIKASAEALPKVQFELVGDFETIRAKVKDSPSNITFYGERPFHEMKVIAKDWDVALIPFIITPLIEATNPVKLYEYSSLGIPVLSTPIPEVLSSDSDARIVTTSAEFNIALKELSATDSPLKRRNRHDFAKRNTWERRAVDFKTCLSEPNNLDR